AAPLTRYALGWGRAALAVVACEQVEIGDVDYAIAVEVCALVVSGVAGPPAEGVSQDVEIREADRVVVVGVPGPHQAHLNADCRVSGERYAAGVRQEPGA